VGTEGGDQGRGKAKGTHGLFRLRRFQGEPAFDALQDAAESVGAVFDTVLPNWEARGEAMSAVVLSSFIRVTLVEGATIEVPITEETGRDLKC